MKTIGYSVVDHEGRLLSKLDIKPRSGGDQELDASFERDFRRSLSVKKIKLANQIFEVLKGAFPDHQFHVVHIVRDHGQYLVDVPTKQRPPWLAGAIEGLGGKLIA